MEEISQEEARQQVDAIRGDPSHPYNQPRHPGHKVAVQQMETLYNTVFPAKDEKGKETHHTPPSEERQIQEAQARISAFKADKTFMTAYLKGDKVAVNRMTRLYQVAHPQLDEEGKLVSLPPEDDDEQFLDAHNRDPADLSPEVKEMLGLVEAGEIERLGDQVIDVLSGRNELSDEDEEFIRYLQGLADPADADDKKFLCELVLWLGEKIASRR